MNMRLIQAPKGLGEAILCLNASPPISVIPVQPGFRPLGTVSTETMDFRLRGSDAMKK